MKGDLYAPMCGFSRLTVEILKMEGVLNIKTVNVLADEAIRQGIKDFT
jgi:monothiol glutaredoxin